MLISQKKQFSNFRHIAQSINRLQIQQTQKQNVSYEGGNIYTGNTMGIVIDMTRPLYRQRSRDYVIYIKLIDQTINSSNIFGTMIKYCSLYLFSKDKSELQVCNTVGQILLLHQFSFHLWNNIKLETKFTSSIEKLSCLTVTDTDVLTIATLTSSKQNLQINNIHIKQRAIKLHKWFQEYFFRDYNPLLGISLLNSYCILVEPFNMILRRVPNQQSQFDKDSSNNILLQDTHKNIFFVSRKCLPTNIPLWTYLYVRDIMHIGNFYQIVLSTTGNLLGLPQQFEKFYEVEMNYCAVSRFNQKLLLRNHKTCQLSKLNYVSSKITPILQLLNNVELYQNKRQSHDVRIQDMYMIEAVVINFKGRLQLFHTEHQIIVDNKFVDRLSNEERKQMIQEEKLAFLYEGVIGVLDRSSQSKGQLLYIHLFSNQQRTQFFDCALIDQLNKNLGMLENSQLQVQVKNKIEEKLQSIVDRSNFTNTVSMLLEPIKSDCLLYRLTNTTFT